MDVVHGLLVPSNESEDSRSCGDLALLWGWLRELLISPEAMGGECIGYNSPYMLPFVVKFLFSAVLTSFQRRMHLVPKKKKIWLSELPNCLESGKISLFPLATHRPEWGRMLKSDNLYFVSDSGWITVCGASARVCW